MSTNCITFSKTSSVRVTSTCLMLFIKAEGDKRNSELRCSRLDRFVFFYYYYYLLVLLPSTPCNHCWSFSCFCGPGSAVCDFEIDRSRISRRVEGEIIQVEAMGSVATREGNMPLNVFNSTTVYLRNGEKKRWGRSGKGRKIDAILVLTLLCVKGNRGGGVLWLLSSPESCF